MIKNTPVTKEEMQKFMKDKRLRSIGGKAHNYLDENGNIVLTPNRKERRKALKKKR